MTARDVDVAIVGAGPAGLAAAVAAKEEGVSKVVILDRNNWLGGILPQCIHDGFGVEETGDSMTGPEYADRYIKRGEELGIETLNETMVLEINDGRELVCASRDGILGIRAGSIIMATGCRERTRWNVMIPGDRPSGIYTAGVAQAFINLYNIMPGARVVILGSGDVGLIMARRFTLEGAKVLGVVEIFPYATGLPRNVVQCLDDYDIPLYLGHTVTLIEGKERLEAVTIAEVDENMTPVSGTETRIPCDTLLLSLGLIPENELSTGAGASIHETTNGPVVNQDLETSIPGVFACGNCLQVYDTVDMLAQDAKRAGKHAARYAKDQARGMRARDSSPRSGLRVAAGAGVRYVVPQRVDRHGELHVSLRCERPVSSPVLSVRVGEEELFRKRLRYANPANMIQALLDIPETVLSSGQTLEVTLHED